MINIPGHIKNLLDEKSSMFEPILWQDNLPYDDRNFSRKNIESLIHKDLLKQPISNEIEMLCRIMNPMKKDTAVLIQNIKNIEFCLELIDKGHYITGVDVSPFIVSYLNRHFHSKLQNRGVFLTKDLRKEPLDISVENILALNNIIRDFPVWYMDNIIRSFYESLADSGLLMIELIQNTLCDAVFYYFEDEDESPWYNNKCFVKYEVINFYRENAFLEKYTVYNLDRDFVGFFSHSNTIYTFYILKELLSKHGFIPEQVKIGWAGRPRNHQLIVFKKRH